MRWIDVDLSSQTVSAYRGHKAVRTFLASTGTWRTPTVTGEFAIYQKFETKDMRGPGYFLRDVPYTMFFHRSYGLHGTNVRWSIGREATHGCLRLYEDEIERLYARVREGTRIQIVYQTVKWGRDEERLYLEVYPDLYGLKPDLMAALEVPRALGLLETIDLEAVLSVLEEARGIPVPVGTIPPSTSTPTS